jgi:hypothetical protein
MNPAWHASKLSILPISSPIVTCQQQPLTALPPIIPLSHHSNIPILKTNFHHFSHSAQNQLQNYISLADEAVDSQL